jgi:hypothetical protein
MKQAIGKINSDFLGYNNNLSLMKDGGNVGIGTTSPTQKLEVNGSTWVSGTVYINRGVNSTEGYTYFDHPGTQVWKQGIFSDNTSTFSIGNGGGFTRLFNITNAGNVGIGTTSPSQKLHLYGSGNQLMFIENTGTYHMYTGLSSNVGIVGSNNATPLSLQTNGVSRVYLDTAGNVGIGTTSPAANLHIQGSNAKIRLTGDTHTSIELEDGGTGDPGYLKTYYYGSLVAQVGAGGTFFNTGDVGIGTASPSNLLHVSQASANTIFRLGNNASYDQFIYFNGGNDWSLGMDYSNSNAFVLSNASSIGTNDRLVVTTGGNLGIGTTSPSAKLEVTGNIYANESSATAISVYNSNSIRAKMSMTGNEGDLTLYGSSANAVIYLSAYYNSYFNGGNVGIGTTSPSFKTTIAADITKSGDINPGTAQLSLEGSTTPGKRMILGYDTNSNGFGFIKSGNYGVTWTPLALQPDGGNVGIGTVSPSTKLDVSGVITATGGNSTNWNTAYGWGNHASASYVPQARTLTINGTSYDLSANRTWTIPTSANIQEAANNGKVTTAASVGTTVITTVATATYDGATFNYVLKDGTNYRAGTIIAVWSAGAVQFNETTTNDIGSTVGVTFAVALNAGNAELRATSATSGWTVKVVTIGI